MVFVFVGKLMLGDRELTSTIEGLLGPRLERGTPWRGNVVVSQAVAAAMSNPEATYLLRTGCGLCLRIVPERWSPFAGRALLEFTTEDCEDVTAEDLEPRGVSILEFVG